MESKPRMLVILDVVTVLLFLTAVGMVFFYAPLEAVMGQVQRVFYFHVANAWVGMLGFMVAAIAGIAFLRKGDRKWYIVGLAAIEISFVFFFTAGKSFCSFFVGLASFTFLNKKARTEHGGPELL